MVVTGTDVPTERFTFIFHSGDKLGYMHMGGFVKFRHFWALRKHRCQQPVEIYDRMKSRVSGRCMWWYSRLGTYTPKAELLKVQVSSCPIFQLSIDLVTMGLDAAPVPPGS